MTVDQLCLGGCTEAMSWRFTVYSYMYFLTGAVTLVTGWISYRRRRDPGMRSLTAALFFIALWSFTGGLELAAVELRGKIFWVTVEYVAAGVFVNCILLFVLRYYHRDRWLTPARLRLFWLPPLLDAGLVITNGWHHWIWVDFIPGPPGSNLLFYQHGLIYYFSVAYQTLLIVLATFSIFSSKALNPSFKKSKTKISASPLSETNI